MKKKVASHDFETDAAGFAQASPIPSRHEIIVAEMRYDSGIIAEKNQLHGSNKRQLAVFQKICANHALGIKARIPTPRLAGRLRVSQPVDELRRIGRASEIAKADYAHAGFVEIQAKPGSAGALLKRLNSFSGVWKASKAPRPVPAVWNARTYQVVTGRSNLARNFEPAQGYLHDAPVGIGIQGAWPKSGGKGKDVTVCDVEANWNRAHQDLPRSIVDFGGKKVSQQLWRDHGTAVLGILAAKLGQSGIRGICPEARLAIQSGFYDTDFNIARAIASAIKKMSRGDILLIEMQAPGPTGKYLPMHYWDDVYSALRAAVDAGIVPVVAAGNGGVNFDDSRWSGTNLQKSFDGFLVGSGVPVSNYYDSEKKYGRIGAPRSAMPNSNYGHRVNMQAWGWHVATLGYGDLQGGAEKRWATLRFAGTSSAAAIVCGAAACLQGVAKARLRTALSASELHAHLFKTGTQQTGGKNIGPQPNLAAAVDLLLK